jgi:hypothetical protein
MKDLFNNDCLTSSINVELENAAGHLKEFAEKVQCGSICKLEISTFQQYEPATLYCEFGSFVDGKRLYFNFFASVEQFEFFANSILSMKKYLDNIKVKQKEYEDNEGDEYDEDDY